MRLKKEQWKLTTEHSLHPTAYPWVHNQWLKTYDHQAYADPRSPRSRDGETHMSKIGSDEDSKFTEKFARLATPLAEFPTDPSSVPS